jgi:AcrR family transcriptional regulator
MTVLKKPGRPANDDLWAQRTSEILDGAAALFAERGFDGANTQELADRLQVGKGTIFRYFPSKRELFLAAADRVMRRLSERIDGSFSPDDDPLQQMRKALEAYLAFFEEHPQFVELLIQERALFKDRKTPTYFEHRERNIGRWRDLLSGLIHQGRLRRMPVEQILDVVNDLVYGAMFTNYFTGRTRPHQEQAREILDVVFYGILSDEERKRVDVSTA